MKILLPVDGSEYTKRMLTTLADAERSDLIVMGTHGHSAFGSAILGSVASGVLARCKVPVLLIR
jgi:nucleotide-binding universal stress UspA family protein